MRWDSIRVRGTDNVRDMPQRVIGESSCPRNTALCKSSSFQVSHNHLLGWNAFLPVLIITGTLLRVCQKLLRITYTPSHLHCMGLRKLSIAEQILHHHHSESEKASKSQPQQKRKTNQETIEIAL